VQKLSRCFKKIFYQLILCLVCAALPIQMTASAAPKSSAKIKTPNPKYAAIVIDANNGKLLYQENANARRFPASLTKMMTLYLLFEAMQAGRIAPETPIPVSKYAAQRPPTKIGFKPGETIAAQAAAKALITRSANDVASAVAEYLGGSEKQFAKNMTAKARQLGMLNTNFANASGLPDNQNYSTARDMAILSLALREHFPQYYHLFNISSFSYRGQTINSHNRLVRNMKGVDGIKTGFISASGFNVATSMRSEGKSLVAVVMGGRSAASRDEHMRSLLNRSLTKASKIKKKAPLVAKATPLVNSNTNIALVRFKLPDGSQAPIPVAKASYADKIQAESQVAAIEQLIESENASLAFAALVQKPNLPAMDELEKLSVNKQTTITPPRERTMPPERLETKLESNISDIDASPAASIASPALNSPPAPLSDREHDALLIAALANQYPGSQPEILSMKTLLEDIDLASLADRDDMLDSSGKDIQEIDIFTTASISNSKKGWVIQIASTKTVREADIALYRALNAASERLDKAEPYLKPATGTETAYRARFAGFKSQKSALNACIDLQSKAIDCYVLQD